MYMVSADGGAVQQLLSGDDGREFSPFWSADGSTLIFGGYPFDRAELEQGLRLYDVKSGAVTPFPGGRGMCCGVWSWDGRYVFAEAPSPVRLMLYDVAAKQWSELFRGAINYFDFSHDGRYVYFDTLWNAEPAIYRVALSDKHVERVVDLRGFNRTAGTFGTWFDLGPDDSLLLLRNTSSEQVYALDWQLP